MQKINLIYLVFYTDGLGNLSLLIYWIFVYSVQNFPGMKDGNIHVYLIQ